MKFQVPQFIEVEDKIFGPLTLKQFIYLVGGGAAIFLLYIALPFFLFILLATPVGALAAALAFYKVHEKPFINVLENAFNYFVKNKIYTWKKVEKKPTASAIPTPPIRPAEITAPALTKNKLSDLAWSLDMKDLNKKNEE